MIGVTIIGIFMVILFILNYMFRLSVLSSSDSANAVYLRFLVPWIMEIKFEMIVGLQVLHNGE